MKTYTYDPLIGITSMTDQNNITTYYEYDSFSRLKYIKDQNKNILKAYDYHYKSKAINP
jgi:YD repeat-containing protein